MKDIEIIEIESDDLYQVLEDYYPQISYVKMAEIYQDIRNIAIEINESRLKVQIEDLEILLQENYVSISRKKQREIIEKLIEKYIEE